MDQCDLYNADLSPHPKTIVHALQVMHFVVMTSLIGCKLIRLNSGTFSFTFENTGTRKICRGFETEQYQKVERSE